MVVFLIRIRLYTMGGFACALKVNHGAVFYPSQFVKMDRRMYIPRSNRNDVSVIRSFQFPPCKIRPIIYALHSV